jgi:FkbM family methyltransferase
VGRTLTGMMKATLKSVLPERQIKWLRAWRHGMHALAVALWGAACSVLPERVVVFLSGHTKLVKKMDYPRAEILLQVESDVEYVTRLHSCEKEPETIEWIHSFFREGDVYYDIGANVGAYALVAAKVFEGRIRVYAFEPGFPTFKQLCTNVVLNDCQDYIVPLQVALSDRTAIETLHYSSLVTGGALHALGQAVDYKGDTFQPVIRQAVLAFSLDDLVKYFGLPLPTHIKLDVDGTELKILKGAGHVFASEVLKSVLVEVVEGDRQSLQLIELLEGVGLHFHSKYKYVHGGDTGPSSRIFNYIFSR